MKRNKFIIAALCAFTLCFYVSAKTDKNISSKKSIVCTIFPQYDWCREILGDKAKDFDLTGQTHVKTLSDKITESVKF